MNKRHYSLKGLSHTSAFHVCCSQVHVAHSAPVQAACMSPAAAIQPPQPHVTSIILCEPSYHHTLQKLQRLQAVTSSLSFVFAANRQKHPVP